MAGSPFWPGRPERDPALMEIEARLRATGASDEAIAALRRGWLEWEPAMRALGRAFPPPPRGPT